MDSNNFVRVQLDLSAARVDLMDRMATATNTRSRREFIDQAIILLSAMIQAKMEGKEVGVIDVSKGEYNPIRMLPILEDAAPGKVSVTNANEKTKSKPAARSGAASTPATRQKLLATS